MNRKKLNLIKEKLFYFFSWFFIIKRILHCQNLKRKHINKGLNIFKFNNLDYLSYKLKKKSDVVVLGCGQSVDELTENDFKLLKSKVTVGLARWFYHSFVPDILVVEFSTSDRDFGDNRWLNHFIDEINKRCHEYRNTLILVEAFDSSFGLHHEILNRISPILKENILFITSFISFNFKNFPTHFIKRRFFLKILHRLNIIWHSRTIAFYGASIAFYLKATNLILIGLDGYEGYFKLFNKYNKNLILNKNFQKKLHSCSNPDYGVPTMTDSFIQISSYINVKTTSKNTIISKFVPTVKID